MLEEGVILRMAKLITKHFSHGATLAGYQKTLLAVIRLLYDVPAGQTIFMLLGGMVAEYVPERLRSLIDERLERIILPSLIVRYLVCTDIQQQLYDIASMIPGRSVLTAEKVVKLADIFVREYMIQRSVNFRSRRDVAVLIIHQLDDDISRIFYPGGISARLKVKYNVHQRFVDLVVHGATASLQNQGIA
jgi:hypothetical protein